MDDLPTRKIYLDYLIAIFLFKCVRFFLASLPPKVGSQPGLLTEHTVASETFGPPYGSPLGLTEGGSEGDIDSIASPQPGQYSVLSESRVLFHEWESMEPWDASMLTDFMEPLPDEYGAYDRPKWTENSKDLDFYINPIARPDQILRHSPQASNVSGLRIESHSTPVTSSPGPANILFDGSPVQGS